MLGKIVLGDDLITFALCRRVQFRLLITSIKTFGRSPQELHHVLVRIVARQRLSLYVLLPYLEHAVSFLKLCRGELKTHKHYLIFALFVFVALLVAVVLVCELVVKLRGDCSKDRHRFSIRGFGHLNAQGFYFSLASIQSRQHRKCRPVMLKRSTASGKRQKIAMRLHPDPFRLLARDGIYCNEAIVTIKEDLHRRRTSRERVVTAIRRELDVSGCGGFVQLVGHGSYCLEILR